MLNKENQLQQSQLQQASWQRNTLTGSMIALALIGGLFFVYYRVKKEKVQLEKQLIESEQNALSLQMNPHFIFNSLNSISSFISRNKTDDARLFPARFAKLMRLTLENSREQQIPLQNEIDALQHKSMAMQVIQERIAILNKMEKTAARITIEDLWDEAKNSRATLVKLNIPVDV